MADYFLDKQLADLDLAETGVKAGYVALKLAEGNDQFKKQLNTNGKISKVDIEDITEMNGFTSMILRCIFHFDKEETFSVICKVFSVNRVRNIMTSFMKGQEQTDESKAMTERVLIKMTKIHNRECSFYEGYAKKGILPLPDIYYIQKLKSKDDTEGSEAVTGILLMEDLTQKAYINGFIDGMRKEKVEVVVKHLASLNKHILCLEDQQSWREDFEESFFCGEESSEDFLTQMMNQILAFDKEAMEVPLRRLCKVFSLEFMQFAGKTCLKEIGIPELLVHGDLHGNNLLWEKLPDDGSQTDVVSAFIDWQLVLVGNPMVDIARLIVLGTDANTHRHELQSHTLKVYYDTLSKLVEQEGKKLDFTFEQSWKAGKQLTEEEEKVHDEKIQKLLSRAKVVVNDAVKVLERIAPDWLLD